MNDQHIPFKHLEQIRDWVDSNRPSLSDARIEEQYREARKTIAMLTNMSIPVPDELEVHARKLEDMLSAPDEETEFMNQLANELIALAKDIRFKWKSHGTKSPPKTLSVTLPDGQKICETTAVNTFVKALIYMGLERCAEYKDIVQYGHPVVSRKENERAGAARNVSGFFVETHSNTSFKAEILKKYAERIGLSMEINVM